MANGIISDDPASSRSDSVPLDNAKVELLKKAAFIKFKVKSDNEGTKWLEYKKKANSLCYEYSKNNQQAKNKIKLLQITTAIKTSFKTYDNYRKYRLKTYFKT